MHFNYGQNELVWSASEFRKECDNHLTSARAVSKFGHAREIMRARSISAMFPEPPGTHCAHAKSIPTSDGRAQLLIGRDGETREHPGRQLSLEVTHVV
jgi:hypothetical protein